MEEYVMRFFVLLLGILILSVSSANAETLVVHLQEGSIAANLSGEDVESAENSFALRTFVILADAGIKSTKITPLPYLGTFIVETKESFAEARDKLMALKEVKSVGRPVESKVLSGE
jgi:hypothetical protein